jgi:hypothetical protein
MASRRNFLATLPVLGATAALSSRTEAISRKAIDHLAAVSTKLIPWETGWRFRLSSIGFE